MSKFLITGTAGFIGFHLANALLEQGNEVVGLDNINEYYDVSLKYARLKAAGIQGKEAEWNRCIQSNRYNNYRFIRMNLEDKEGLLRLFKIEKFEYVVHLAAQAGVRYSIDNPDVYIESNVIGFLNILEACRYFPVRYFLYASSSSVYGNNEKVPFSENDYVDHPISLYAATKKSNELMAFTYYHLYKISSTGLRFFTVYGPWGRPDMAVYKFTKAMLENKPIKVYAEGNLVRDFTFIDDIIKGVAGVLMKQKDIQPPMVMNIGNNNPVSVNSLITEIEKCINKKATIEYLPMQPGDANSTFADISLIHEYCGFRPEVSLREGIEKFCEWYKQGISYQA